MRCVGATERDPAKFAQALFHLTRNRVGEVTLTENVTSTTITDPTITPDTVIVFDPLTANAAAALTTTFVAAADRAKGTFTITHANDAATDRTFRWIAAGD